MEFFDIYGGKPLAGEVQLCSAKNAVLPILAGCVLTSKKVVLHNVEPLADTLVMIDILRSIGVKIRWQENSLVVDASQIYGNNLPAELCKKLRASVFLLGPLIARTGGAIVPLPGGCNIGARPIDIHINGLMALGAKIVQTPDKILCDGKFFVGGRYKLKMPSVGATENLVMSAILAENRVTILQNCAKEPEIVDLCNFLVMLGAKIYGAGTSNITIVGVKALNGGEYTPITDRIAAGTYMLTAAICGGNITLHGAKMEHNKNLITILSKLGCAFSVNSANINIVCSAIKPYNINITTGAYPQFATDLQSPTVALLACQNGTHTLTETMFENRFKQIAGLNSLGANIVTRGQTAIIYGKNGCYKGGVAAATDLRGGAALVLTGLAYGGLTRVENIEYIDRGYYKLENQLSLLGQDIVRKNI